MAFEGLSPAPLDLSLITAKFSSWYILSFVTPLVSQHFVYFIYVVA